MLQGTKVNIYSRQLKQFHCLWPGLPCKLNCTSRTQLIVQFCRRWQQAPGIPSLRLSPCLHRKVPKRGPDIPNNQILALAMAENRSWGGPLLEHNISHTSKLAGLSRTRGSLRCGANREHSSYLGFYKSFSYQSFRAPNATSSSPGYHVDLWLGIYELVWIK